MKAILPLLAALAFLALPVTAAGADASSDSAYRACMDKSGGTNRDWDVCGSELIKCEDAALNAEWKRLYPSLPAASKTALLEEQRLWIAYRAKACGLYASGDYGREGQVLTYPTCVAQVIRSRRAELQGFGADEGR